MAARSPQRRAPESCWRPARSTARGSRAGPAPRAPCRIFLPSLDRRTRQHRFARFHPVGVVERVPRRCDIARGGMRLLMAYELADQSPRDAELRIALDIRIGGIIDLGNQRLEAGLED